MQQENSKIYMISTKEQTDRCWLALYAAGFVVRETLIGFGASKRKSKTCSQDLW
jgi:hypothetical protein